MVIINFHHQNGRRTDIINFAGKNAYCTPITKRPKKIKILLIEDFQPWYDFFKMISEDCQLDWQLEHIGEMQEENQKKLEIILAKNNHYIELLSISKIFAGQLAEKSRDISTSLAHDAILLTPLILRLYEQAQDHKHFDIQNRCLDIWDLMFEKRVGNARDLMKNVEQ